MEQEKIQEELRDVIDSLHRYLAVRKNNASFVISFVGFKEGKCCDCGDECEDMYDESGSRIFVYGHKENLRVMLNELRDVIEDEEEDPEHPGFVNI